MHLRRLPLKLHADDTHVILRYWEMDTARLPGIVRRLEQMTQDEVERAWEHTGRLFAARHRDFENRLRDHARIANTKLGKPSAQEEIRELLLGACLTMEYSIAAAALFNPSIVRHPDQTGLPEGAVRFILSLRAVGEGHISSVVFREGVIDASQQVTLSPDTDWRTPASVRDITNAQYTAYFDSGIPLSERVLFPMERSEANGMEDLRLVEFADGDGPLYYGTYTAYDGQQIRSKIVETREFQTFKVSHMTGAAVRGKGIAIFPRKIRNKYAAIGRQDGVNMTMMYSGDITEWQSTMPLLGPTAPHQIMQTGNCGPPIETEHGWLLLTHGVGPMRRYTLGAALLDLERPERVMHVLPKPLMEPLDAERNGYVPNVLYTCGWMQHGADILIPYAMSDKECGFALVNTEELTDTLRKEG